MGNRRLTFHPKINGTDKGQRRRKEMHSRNNSWKLHVAEHAKLK